MRKSRFTDSQILAILKQAEGGVPVPDLCRERGMSSATFYKWRVKFGGMENALRVKPEDVREQYERQLKDLQEAYGEAMLELRARKKSCNPCWARTRADSLYLAGAER